MANNARNAEIAQQQTSILNSSRCQSPPAEGSTARRGWNRYLHLGPFVWLRTSTLEQPTSSISPAPVWWNSKPTHFIWRVENFSYSTGDNGYVSSLHPPTSISRIGFEIALRVRGPRCFTPPSINGGEGGRERSALPAMKEETAEGDEAPER